MSNIIYDNLSDKELKTGYWYVTHRVLLKKIGIFALAIVSGGLLIYGAIGLINYYIVDRSQNLALEADLAKNKLDQNLLAEINKPKDLQILETTVVEGAGGSYDLITEVINPNAQWAVEAVDYYYVFGEDKSNVKNEYLLPGQEKFLLFLNYKSNKTISSANIVLENIKWKKVADYGSLAEKVLQFEFANEKVLSSKKSGLSAEQAVANVSFDILNKSPYNFVEPRFIVFLTRGKQPVGVTQFSVDSLLSGESRSQSINFFQDVSSGTTVSIIPDINILDSSVFKGFDNTGKLK
ncbi:MAG: hypothetical protein AAB766_04145 [Patescibacteria group bacterium]